jgi:hypothetical protein
MVDKKKAAGPAWWVLWWVLGATLITLKLGGWTVVAQWSWWLVTAPIWAPSITAILFFGVAFLVVVTVTTLMEVHDKANTKEKSDE